MILTVNQSQVCLLWLSGLSQAQVPRFFAFSQSAFSPFCACAANLLQPLFQDSHSGRLCNVRLASFAWQCC